jgi:hypothetical protein
MSAFEGKPTSRLIKAMSAFEPKRDMPATHTGAKSEEAAPAGRPPGLQIPHSPRMVSPQSNPFGEMLCRQERFGTGQRLPRAFFLHCVVTATAVRQAPW